MSLPEEGEEEAYNELEHEEEEEEEETPDRTLEPENQRLCIICKQLLDEWENGGASIVHPFEDCRCRAHGGCWELHVDRYKSNKAKSVICPYHTCQICWTDGTDAKPIESIYDTCLCRGHKSCKLRLKNDGGFVHCLFHACCCGQFLSAKEKLPVVVLHCGCRGHIEHLQKLYPKYGYNCPFCRSKLPEAQLNAIWASNAIAFAQLVMYRRNGGAAERAAAFSKDNILKTKRNKISLINQGIRLTELIAADFSLKELCEKLKFTFNDFVKLGLSVVHFKSPPFNDIKYWPKVPISDDDDEPLDSDDDVEDESNGEKMYVPSLRTQTNSAKNNLVNGKTLANCGMTAMMWFANCNSLTTIAALGYTMEDLVASGFDKVDLMRGDYHIDEYVDKMGLTAECLINGLDMSRSELLKMFTIRGWTYKSILSQKNVSPSHQRLLVNLLKKESNGRLVTIVQKEKTKLRVTDAEDRLESDYNLYFKQQMNIPMPDNLIIPDDATIYLEFDSATNQIDYKQLERYATERITYAEPTPTNVPLPPRPAYVEKELTQQFERVITSINQHKQESQPPPLDPTANIPLVDEAPVNRFTERVIPTQRPQPFQQTTTPKPIPHRKTTSYLSRFDSN